MADTTGSSWDLVNYVGMLSTPSRRNTPITALAGGENGGKNTQNDEFPLSVEYSLPAAGQNVVTEDASVTAPASVDVTTSQTKNAVQIQHRSVLVTYKTISNMNRLTGIADASQPLAIQDHVDFQIQTKFDAIMRDFEYTWINGSYVASSASSAATASRGTLEAISDASNGVAAGSADLTKELINQMLREAYADGAVFNDPIFWVNAFQKQQISGIYEYVPTDRFIGGSNIQAIETDMGRVSVALNPHMAAASLLMLDMSFCSNVFQPVPGKGNFFYEDLSRTGAAVKGQIYTQFGCDYGPVYMHNAITGLTTS
jgi:hypothetical protein